MKDVNAEAVSWFTRLRAPDAASADRHEFKQWLAADIEHELAYARIKQEWRDVGALESWARGELSQLNLTSANRTRRSRTLWVTGLATAASLLLLVIWLQRVESAGAPVMVITTAKTEQLRLALDDGSSLHVNTASELEVRYTARVREVVMKRGEIIFDVDHDLSRPFVVRAGEHSVIAVGTRFAVRRGDDGEWAVTVIEGRVAVVPGAPGDYTAIVGQNVSAWQEGVLLDANEQVEIDSSGQIRPEQQADADAATAWQQGMLKFHNTPLRVAAKEISRYTHREIQVADGVPDYAVTGIIHIRNRESMVSLLAEVVPVTPVNNAAGITILYEDPSH
jgi:transmembrane sensor